MADDLGLVNKLYYGDNLFIMREYIPDESVDLIYLDPPFNSKATYNVLFHEKDGTDSPAQITAFEDTWHWDMSAESAYEELVKEGPAKLADLIQAMRSFLGTNDMMAYLTMMAIRLVEMHRVLKKTGSLYLHCDPTASHYIKLVMDAVFGPNSFTNEIVWLRSDPKGLAFNRFASSHDILFHYRKSEKGLWNPQYVEHDPKYVETWYRFVEPETGRRYKLDNLLNPNKNRPNLTYEFLGVTRVWRWNKARMQKAYEEGLVVQSKPGNVPMLKRYLDEQKGTPVSDVWSDIRPIRGGAVERLGYPTQKPEALLERIIQASSNEGDVVVDPFCGCGTTIAVAERLHRHWIGIDITHLAITLMERRLKDAFGEELAPYKVIGDPKDIGGARELADHNRYQFEWWALSLVEARPAQDKKKGSDKGIDGFINFFDDESGKAKKIVVQVKSGKVGVAQVHELCHVVEREKAVIGAFVTLQKPTGPMKKEAAGFGFYEPEHFPEKKYPRLQILTIEELLAGAELKYPKTLAPQATFKKAERKSKAKKKTDHPEAMFDEGMLAAESEDDYE